MSRKYIQHVRSTDVETIQEYGLDKIVPKLPEADNLMEGEIAINYAENNEVISIKNEQDEVVKFLNEKVIYENEEITAAAIAKINNAISDFYTKQEVDDKIADAGIPDMSDYYTKSEIDNAGYLTSETQLSTNTVGNGNVVTNITVNGHQITLTKESTFLTQDEVQALIDEVVSGGADLTNYYTKSETNGLLEDKVDYLTFSSTQEMQNTTNGIRLGTIGVVDGERSKDVYVLIYRNGNKEWYDVTTDNTGGGDTPITHNTIETLTPTVDLDRPIEVEVGDTYDEAFSKVLGIIEDNEQVTAEALTDLENDKANTEDLADVAFSGSFNDLEDKPRVIPTDWQYDALERKTSIAMNNEEQDSSVLISFKEGKMIFPSLNESEYIDATTYTGRALGTEEKLTNAELLTDGAGMIGFYDEPNDENITVREALVNLQEAVDGIEIITAGTGLTKSGSTLNHTNSVTASENAVVKAFTFDSEGHINSSADAAKYTIESIGTDIRFTDVFLRRCQKDYSTGSESGTNGNALTTQYVPVVTEATSRPNNDEQLTPTTDPINNTDPVDAGGNIGGKAEMGDIRP